MESDENSSEGSSSVELEEADLLLEHDNISLQAWSSDDDDVSRFGNNLTRRSIRAGSSASVCSDRSQTELADSPSFQDGDESNDDMGEPLLHRVQLREYERYYDARPRLRSAVHPMIICFVCFIFFVMFILIFSHIFIAVSIFNF